MLFFSRRFHSLCDTHLQPSDLTPDILPIYGFPFLCVVDECTSSVGCLLRSHLQRFSELSRNETHPGCQHAFAGAVAFRFLRRAKLKALSGPLQTGLCFFQILSPAPPSTRLAVMPARISIGRCDGVDTFHIIDPMSDLGAPWTPVVQQFRAGTLETCNLTTRYSHRGITFDLKSLSRPVAA